MKHPNKAPFEGTLALLDTPSDKPPKGSDGHRVILSKEAAEDSLGSLIGMPVGFSKGWDEHDFRLKCGLIEDAWIVGNELRVRGYVFAKDFPDVAEKLADPNVTLGLSYEMVEIHIADFDAEIWTIVETTFTGAAVVLAGKAAYTRTKIALLTATAETQRGTLSIIGKGQVRGA